MKQKGVNISIPIHAATQFIPKFLKERELLYSVAP